MDRADSPGERLAKYLKERLDRVEACYIDVENNALDDETELMRRVNDGTVDNEQFSKAYRHINFSVRNTFRYAMLVAVCSFVEEALVQIAKQVDKDYDAHIQGAERENRAKAHLDLLTEHAGLEIASIASESAQFKHMIVLRNCVVHAWGNVAEDRRPSDVKEAVERLAEAGRDGNFDIVGITGDGYLEFGEDIISTAIELAESIINHVSRSVLGQGIVPW